MEPSNNIVLSLLQQMSHINSTSTDRGMMDWRSDGHGAHVVSFLVGWYDVLRKKDQGSRTVVNGKGKELRGARCWRGH